jgi:hypothetical protein
MRKITAFSLILLIFSTPAYCQEAPRASRRGTGAGYGTRDATVLSMMGWGVGMGLGIAILCGSLHQSKASSGSSSDGGNTHSGTTTH